MKTKHFISLCAALFVLAALFGSFTASANGANGGGTELSPKLTITLHIHGYTVTANGSTATVKCADDCPDHLQYTATLNVADKTYDGEPISGATVTTSSGFPTDKVAVGSITYKDASGNTVASPTDAGTYTASVTVGDKTISKTFEIKDQSETIRYTKTTKVGNNYLIEVKSTNHYILVPNKSDTYYHMKDNGIYVVKGTITLQKGLVFGNNVTLILCKDAKLVVQVGLWHISSQLDIYTQEGGENAVLEITGSTEHPAMSGNIAIYGGNVTVNKGSNDNLVADDINLTLGAGVTVAGLTGGTTQEDGSVKYTKTDLSSLTSLSVKPAALVTAAPTAKTGLTANGSDQVLVEAGTAANGTMQYALGENATTAPVSGWSVDIPTGKDANTYYVWYKAVVDENNESAAACVMVTISRQPSSGPSTPPTTTVTVPVSGDDESVNVTVTVSGDTATITSADVDKVLEAEDVGTVTIDVSTLKADVTEVVIPGAMVDKIADAVADEENNADGLEIKLPSGTVTFDADAVAAIAEQANGKDLRLNLEDIEENKLNTAQKSAVDDMNVQEVLDVYMTSGGQRISDFKGGKAVVEVSYTLKDGQTGRGVIVWYVAEDGTKTEVPTTYNDEAVSFTVEHFSNYVIAYDEERAAACPRDDTCPMSAFSDLDKTKWYHDALHYALENKIMYGVGDGKFNPNGTMSRAMFATILYRIAGEPEVTGENTFTDVEAGRWYTDAVIWAAGEKIIEGYGNNIFGTNDPVTREQMAAIFWRYQGKPTAENADLSAFSDTGEISTWAQDAFEWAVSAGIISGKGGGILDPKGDATRAEVAQIVMNYDLKVK